jgi:hypothetical protein
VKVNWILYGGKERERERERDVESFNLWSILYGFVFVVRVGLGSG